MSYSGHLLGRSCLPAEMQSVYFTAPADWAREGSGKLYVLAIVLVKKKKKKAGHIFTDPNLESEYYQFHI